MLLDFRADTAFFKSHQRFSIGSLSLVTAIATPKLSNPSFETKPWWTLRCASDHCPVGRSSDAQASALELMACHFVAEFLGI